MRIVYFTSVLFAISTALVLSNASVLKEGFYRKSCLRAEEIVKEVTRKHVSSNPNLPAKLLRLHFHDCFVRGCDGSVLLNSTNNTQAEKEAIPNQTLSGFDVIDDIKEEVEKECPGIVSCADILALSARDAVSLQYGMPLWKVPTGRRDGNVSLATEANTNLPSPHSDFSALNNSFASKGLSVRDLVALSGAHTIGVGSCSIIKNRLYNFTGVGDQDPSLNATYAEFLKTKCMNSSNDSTTMVEMDPGSALSFDNHYFGNLKEHKGLCISDTALLTNKQSSEFVEKLLNSDKFFKEFAKSIQKMGVIGVLTGSMGEIRKQCKMVNYVQQV